MNYFITGTDTAVGKTYVAALLTRALRRAGLDTVALKPICCGSRDDVDALCDASENELSADVTNPVWLASPVAPLVSARLENRELEIGELETWFRHHRSRRRSLLVEGCRRMAHPGDSEVEGSRSRRAFQTSRAPRGGQPWMSSNHTLLTIESIRAHDQECHALILNSPPGVADVATETNRRALEEICDVPILFEIARDQQSIELAVA